MANLVTNKPAAKSIESPPPGEMAAPPSTIRGGVSFERVRPAVFLPLLLLLGYAGAFGVAALGLAPVVAFDDHPGQLYRVWHVVRHGALPWTWNPGWWTGYPELQFYPPGFAYLGALLHWASSGLLPVPAVYHALVWAAYIAPGVTAFALLARLLGEGWSALPGAFVILTVSAGIASGVEGGVHWGMVPARLAWALLPVLIAVLSGWVEGSRPFPMTGAVLLMAAIAVTHPAHLPTAAVILLLASVAPGRGHRARIGTALRALGLAALLTAIWTLPLLTRLDHMRPLAWGTLLTGPASAITTPLPLVLIGFAVLALWPGPGRLPGTGALVARLPWTVCAVVAVDRLVAEPLGIRWLPADRVADGAWMALLLAAGLGLGRALQLLPVRFQPRPLAAVAAVVGAALLSLPGATLTLWPRPAVWVSFDSIARGFRLPALWTSLRAAPEGHVLIARSGLPLVHGAEWHRPHSHALALVPVETGRAIVHGTFTHPSPTAALVYRGDAGPGAITQLAEQLDGRSMFGRPLADLDATRFNQIADRLGICTIVVLDEDVAVRQVMDANPELERWRSSPPFLVYTRQARCPVPAQVGPGRWRVALEGQPATWVSAHMAFYPLWRAAQAGEPIPTRRGELGELEVKLAHRDYPVELLYRPSWPEWLGSALSAGAALTCLGLLLPRARAALTRGGRS
jgi:hypothetical protein